MDLCWHPDDAGPMMYTYFFNWKCITKKKSWPSTNVSWKWQCPTACFWSTGSVNSSAVSPFALCRCPLTWKLFWFWLPAHSQAPKVTICLYKMNTFSKLPSRLHRWYILTLYYLVVFIILLICQMIFPGFWQCFCCSKNQHCFLDLISTLSYGKLSHIVKQFNLLKPSNKFIYQTVGVMEYTYILRFSNKNVWKKARQIDVLKPRSE